MLCSQASRGSSSGRLFVPPCFVPEGEFDSIPESELVIDDSEIILDDVFSSSDFVGNFFILESLGNKFDNSALSFAGYALSVSFFSKHNCLRYKSVASLTRLMPLVIPNRKNSRLKCAFTVRRAILSCRAISSLSHPCRSNSTICCSRCPKRTGFSLITTPSKCAREATAPDPKHTSENRPGGSGCDCN